MNPWERSVKLVRRAYDTPLIAQPLSVRSVVRGVFYAGEYEDQYYREFTKMIWVVRGTAEVSYADKCFQAKKGQVAIFLPSTRQIARALSQELEIRWITWDSEGATNVLKEFGLTNAGVYTAGNCPDQLFDNIERLLKNPTKQNELEAGADSYRLLGYVDALSHSTASEDPLIKEVKQRIENKWNDPLLSVEELAEAIGLNRTTLSKRFAVVTGTSPKSYIIHLRMQRAMTLLKQSMVPISDVAIACGYPDVNYFIRLFHRKTGCSPLVFRNRGV